VGEARGGDDSGRPWWLASTQEDTMKRTTLVLVIKDNSPEDKLKALTDGLLESGCEIEHASLQREGHANLPLIGTMADLVEVQVPATQVLNPTPEQYAILQTAQEAAETAKVLLKEFRSFNRYERKDDKAKAPRGKKEGAAPEAGGETQEAEA